MFWLLWSSVWRFWRLQSRPRVGAAVHSGSKRKCIVIERRKGVHTFMLRYDPKLHREALREPGRFVLESKGIFSWADAAAMCSMIRTLRDLKHGN